MKIGFVGLGNMGRPMARNLAKAGHDLLVHNRTRTRSDKLARQFPDRIHAVRLEEACRCDIVMTMISDDRALEDCAFNSGGVLVSLQENAIHVSLSTISPALSRRLAEEHGHRRQHFIAAPVFGRPDAAEAARLLIVAAGPAEPMERVRPLLEILGRKTYVVGPEAPMANICKLGGNFMLASMLESMGEALSLAKKGGLDPRLFVEIVCGSFFQSPVYENYGRIISERRFTPAGFAVTLGLKDVRLVLAAADQMAVPMPLASLAYSHLLEALATGSGDKDWAAISDIIAAKAGLR